MENIYDTNDEFNFEKLVLQKPALLSNGNYFIRFLVNGEHLYIQPPKCKTRQGIVKAGKKYYSDFMFTNENDQFIHWMENLETHCQQAIFKNREQWFENSMEMHDIENYFTSPMKTFKSGTFYIIRINVPGVLGKPSLKIYDENENEVEMESINDKSDIVTILEIQGIKCSARSFQIEIEMKQIMVMKPVKLFEKCIIKTKPKSTDGLSLDENLVEQNETNLGNLIAVSSNQHTEHTTEENKIAVNDLEAEAEAEAEAETNVLNKPKIVEAKIEPNKIKVDTETSSIDMQEVDFHLDELVDTEIVQIKQRNDVYYEMYREARRKAKVARDLALSSYLEAKRIKNAYMLDDINDSDLETETEEEMSSFENM